MKTYKAYTLMEMIVVMSIMIIMLSVGIGSYMNFSNTMRFNEDVANLEHDILLIQRAAMLLEKEPNDRWLYGIGIDFSNIQEGSYSYFKWCSPYNDFGHANTRARDLPSTIPTFGTGAVCEKVAGVGNSVLATLPTYSTGYINSFNKISIDNPYIVFESITGRAFIYDSSRNLQDSDMNITFQGVNGKTHVLNVKQYSGRTNLILNSL